VPKSFHNFNIDDFVAEDDFMQEVKMYFTYYLSHIEEKFLNNEGLLLVGRNGIGKTLLASLVVKEAYRFRYTSKKTTFQEYITEYTRLWSTKDLEEKTMLEENFYNEFKAVEFLVLDELGKEIDSSIGVPILEDCLRYREEKGLVTIVCTNMSKDALAEKYGRSVTSLLKGNMRCITLSGEDKRSEVFKVRIDDCE
jgi:DNA replication protein DnaC